MHLKPRASVWSACVFSAAFLISLRSLILISPQCFSLAGSSIPASSDDHQATRSALECGDLSPLLAGDLSPSSWQTTREHPHAAERAVVWLTSQPNRKSGDKSPHSKILRRSR